MKKRAKKEKKIFGNIPVIPFVTVLVIAAFGIVFFQLQQSEIYTPSSIECSGTLHFGLNQTVANQDSIVGFLTNVTTSAPTHPQCGGRTVNIKEGSCSNPTISSCNLGSEKKRPWPATGYYQDCSSTFFASSTAGIQNYSACIDMNLNGTYEGNEQQMAVLNVTCTGNWSCTNWTNCVSRLQTRTCTDLNNCSTAVSPDTQQSCGTPHHHGGGGCTENWSCTSWSECSNGLQTRTCTDLEECGTTSNKPATVQSCTVTCTPYWSCGEWSECLDGKQSQLCEDSNKCLANYSYASSRDCCAENWQFVEWSECLEGNRFKIYEEFNNCGTTLLQPQPETEECGKNKMLTYILIGAGILIIALAILFFAMKGKKRSILSAGKAEKPADKNKAKPEKPSVSSELQDYIKKALNAGMTKDDVKARFIEAGWPKDMVDKALEK